VSFLISITTHTTTVIKAPSRSGPDEVEVKRYTVSLLNRAGTPVLQSKPFAKIDRAIDLAFRINDQLNEYDTRLPNDRPKYQVRIDLGVNRKTFDHYHLQHYGFTQ
jgi:hypothetical protein